MQRAAKPNAAWGSAGVVRWANFVTKKAKNCHLGLKYHALEAGEHQLAGIELAAMT
jgi:hypothetical protein